MCQVKIGVTLRTQWCYWWLVIKESFILVRIKYTIIVHHIHPDGQCKKVSLQAFRTRQSRSSKTIAVYTQARVYRENRITNHDSNCTKRLTARRLRRSLVRLRSSMLAETKLPPRRPNDLASGVFKNFFSFVLELTWLGIADLNVW